MFKKIVHFSSIFVGTQMSNTMFPKNHIEINI